MHPSGFECVCVEKVLMHRWKRCMKVCVTGEWPIYCVNWTLTLDGFLETWWMLRFLNTATTNTDMCWRKIHLIAFTLPNYLIDCVLFCFSLYRFSLCVLITCTHFSSVYSHFVSLKMSEILLHSLSVVLNVTVASLDAA